MGFLKKLFGPPEPAAPIVQRLPTPKETALASGRIKAAHALLQKFLTSKEDNGIIRFLGPASEQLNSARKLDPTATATIDDYTYTIEDLAAELLCYEASEYYTVGRHYAYQTISAETLSDAGADASYVSKEYDRNRTKKSKEAFANALTAAEKAVKYQPNNPMYQRTLGLVLRELNRWPEGDACIKKAFELNPNDIETIKYMK